jgi:hypothetical protein
MLRPRMMILGMSVLFVSVTCVALHAQFNRVGPVTSGQGVPVRSDLSAWAYPNVHAGDGGSGGGSEKVTIAQQDLDSSDAYSDIWKFYARKTHLDPLDPMRCTSFTTKGTYSYGDNHGNAFQSLMTGVNSSYVRKATFTRVVGQDVFYVTITNRLAEPETSISVERVKV